MHQLRLDEHAGNAGSRHSMRSPEMIGIPGLADAGPVLGSCSAYVQTHMSKRITVEDLAKICKLDIFQLIRVFHREYTTTPYAFVLHSRIERAKELLMTGVTIANAAIDTGFSDQSHLTRHFKRLEGTTPKAFQSSHKMWRANLPTHGTA